MIEISHVSKSYDDNSIIEDLSLQIPKGGMVSIIGSNGAGKSTLLTMISRLLPITKGRITVDGMDVTKAKGADFAKRLSILRQENTLTARITVEDLVSFGRYPYSHGVLTKEDKTFVDNAISYLGLDPYRKRFLDELSGGQRQRAFVAMVISQNTDYILLDEPLNNLDMRHAVSMMKRLRNAADELGKTIIMVMHDLNFASCYSDLIIALKEGKLVYSGTPENVMKDEILSAIYDIDIKVKDIDGQKIAVYYR